MDKIIHGLEPNKNYKIRYRAIYNDDRQSAPTIAYSISTPGSPTPPEVDQDTITVDSQSFKDGIVISWTAPDPDPEKPEVADYFVQITDDLNDWEKFDSVTTETKTIFTEQDQLVSFGILVPVIYIRVITRSINKLFSTPSSYKEYEFAAETGLRPPDIVTALGLNYSWRVNWAYVPSIPDVVVGYKIYDGETLVTTINNPSTNTYTSPQDLEIGGTIKTIGVSAIDAEGNESPIRYANPIVINEIVLDDVAPPQRENINFTADTDSPDVICTWTNTNLAGDEELNDDLAGVTIRYARSDDQNNFFWLDIPFTYSENRTTATITNLIPNTSYRFQLSTFDDLFNRTEYSPVITVTTGRDTIPPPKPCPPSVAAGTNAGGPMMIRVQQFAREPLVSDPNNSNGDPTKPMPFDTAFFQIWMLDSGQITAPSGTTNPNATQVGIVVAGFNGIETQTIIYNSSLATGQTRYFYTRAVDTSGNIGEASNAKLSSEMVVFGDAHIDNLSARKITTDTLNASTTITVGTGTGSIKIDGSGKLYSGTGTYANQNTGFYLDNSGYFSLKDRLTFNPSTNLLSVVGNITAESGSFTGNLGVVTRGAIYAGNPQEPLDDPNLNLTAEARARSNQIVITRNGMAAKGSSGTVFALDTDTGNVILTGNVTANTFNGYALNVYGGGSINPARINVTNFSPNVEYGILSSDGKDVILKAASTSSNPAKIRWLDGSNLQRGTLGWEVSSESGNFPNNFVLRAIGNGSTVGQLLLDAGNDGILKLRSGDLYFENVYSNLLDGGRVLVINPNGRVGYATASNSTVMAGYINATDNNGNANRITYSTTAASTYYANNTNLGTPREGDVHLRYV